MHSCEQLLAELGTFVSGGVIEAAPSPAAGDASAVIVFLIEAATTAHKTAVATDNVHAMDGTLSLLAKTTALSRALAVCKKRKKTSFNLAGLFIL